MGGTYTLSLKINNIDYSTGPLGITDKYETFRDKMRAAYHDKFKDITVVGSGSPTINYKNLISFDGVGLVGDLAMLTLTSNDITGGKTCPHWIPKVIFKE